MKARTCPPWFPPGTHHIFRPLSVQFCTLLRSSLRYVGGQPDRMDMRAPTATASVDDRPFNNLIRRLNGDDYALIEPSLVSYEAAPNDLLYSPGDDVETVH